MKNKGKNFIWNIIGVSIYGLISLFLLIIVKRINGLEVSGVFSYAYSICTLFYFISMYYSRTYQIANYNDSKSFNQFMSFRFISVPLSIIILVLFCFISRFDSYKTIVVLLLMIFRSVDAIADTIYGYLQEHDNLYQVGISYTIKYTLGVILFLVVDLITNNLLLSIVSMIAVDILVMFLYDIRCYKSLSKDKFKLDFSNNKLILKESFSIFIFTVLITYLANVQKYVMVYYTNNDYQSMFGILIMPATVLSLVGIYIINPFINELKKMYRENNFKKFKNVSIKILLCLLAIGVLGTIVCAFIGIPFLNIIYNINLDQYRLCLVLIIIASIFTASCSIISNYLIILEKNIYQTITYVLCSVLTTVFSIVIINFIDDIIVSQTISYLVSYILCFMMYVIYYLIIINKHIKENKHEKR